MNIKNIVWNLCGLGFPAIAAALAIPQIIQMIGVERFGLLTIAWSMIGLAGLFDLGVGRATTQYIAKLLGLSRHQDIPVVCSVGISLTWAAGLGAATIMVLGVFSGVTQFINASPEVEVELKYAAMVLAATLPIQAVSATYRGVNEAYADFRGISLIRIFLGVISFAGPYATAFFTVNLAWIATSLLVSRILGLVAFRRLALAHIRKQSATKSSQPESSELNLSRSQIRRELIRFGGWFTVGCGAYLVLSLSERVAIGVIISAASISAFAIPAEVVMQSLAVVTAISTIAFPQLSTLVHLDTRAALKLFHVWLFRVLIVMFVICSAMAMLLPVVLPMWVGDSLPLQSVPIGQVLCLGVLMQSVSTMCFSMIHANGRADIPTIVRLAIVPLHILVLSLLTFSFGCFGVAIAWVVRTSFESLMLYWFGIVTHKNTVMAVPETESLSTRSSLLGAGSESA